MRFSLIFSIVMIIFIWTNSIFPASVSSEHSGFVVSIVNDLLSIVNLSVQEDILSLIIRKLAHFTEFLILGLSLSIYLFKIKKELIHTLWIGLIVALIDETIQLFVDGRSGSMTDVFIDMAGIITGLICVWLISKSSMKTIS